MSDPAALLPVDPLLQIPESGEPFLQGSVCTQCHTVFTDDPRTACARCGARNTLQPRRLAPRGEVLAWTRVERSFPGIPTPYHSVVIALDGGGTIKTTLVDCDDESVASGLRVALTFREAPWPDRSGNRYLIYQVVPAEQENER